MASKGNKIIKMKKKYTFSFVSFVFMFILVYIIYQIVHVLIYTPVQVYNIGTPTYDYSSQYYEGIILRNETSVYSDSDGFITYYIGNGQYVRSDTLLYTTDKTNEFQNMITSVFTDSSALSRTSLNAVQSSLSSSINSYNPIEFQSVTAAVTDIKAEIMSSFLTDAINKLGTVDLSGYEPFYSASIGFVSLYQDSYDGLTAENLSAAHFSHQNYEKKTYRSGNYIRSGDFVCKLVEDNTFSVAFPLTTELQASLRSKTQLSIRTADGVVVSGTYTETTGQDGTAIGVISFVKYGVNYLWDRFISFQIVDISNSQSQTGYKIPVSSIITKSFYVVDAEYLTRGGDSTGWGVYIQGSDGVRFVNIQKYEESDGSAYIIGKDLYDGAVLQKPDSSDTIQLGVKTQLEGVFQVNNGYCVFKRIKRIGDSIDSSYAIVEKDTTYGLSDFERIVINGSSMEENQIVYQ